MLQAKEGKSNLIDKNDPIQYHENQEKMNTKLIPKIVPLYDGQELNINQQLISNGLSTISIRNIKTNESAIKKRNSFFNLHRPELKGLHIVSTMNNQERILQQHILKEVETIHKIRSMKSFSTINKCQEKNQAMLENNNIDTAKLQLETDQLCVLDEEIKSTVIN
ncbi:uncharacterized protein LOC112687570 [Sipha flava]|uniref:Uncharacterized protein LOC112687570 n=1 Tax=Sipha flava TaxID=143950 RepID=A0A8B8FZZ9_9HEMI|nr:uncharacterized protein LOC112687570 [Sipha flava]